MNNLHPLFQRILAPVAGRATSSQDKLAEFDTLRETVEPNPLSLQQLIASYREDGIPPARAIKYITATRMASRNATGKGYRAARRVQKLGQQTAVSLTLLAERMAKMQRESRRDALCEAMAEARTFAHHYRTQIHE